MSHFGWMLVIFPIAIDAGFLTTDNIVTENIPAFSDIPILREKYPDDALLNFTELSIKYGYTSVEEHTVKTKDGYILTFFRIPSPKNTTKTNPGDPLLLMHGFTANADVFLLPNPDKAIGTMLVNAGYDVWFGSVRGTNYGRRHCTLDADTDRDFWCFSYDEMSQYDVPAQIDYILQETQCRSLTYIGHSQGTTMVFALPAYRPDLMSKINGIIALAPVAYMTHTKNRFLRAITNFLPEINTLIDTLGIHELFANSSVEYQTVELLAQIIPTFSGKITSELCGNDPIQIPDSLMPVLFGHLPRGVSDRDALHLGQGIHSDKFQRYDYGPLGNMAKYGQSTPPEYNVSMVSSPVAVFIGLNDLLSSPIDVDKLITYLPNVVEKNVVPRKDWNHLDHLVAKDARKFVGEPILKLLKDMVETSSCD